MDASKSIRYLIFAALVSTIPVHSKNLFNYCTDVFQEPKQSVVDVANRQASTKTKIGVAAVSLTIASLLIYALIKYVIHKRKHAVIKKENTDTHEEARPYDIGYKLSKAAYYNDHGALDALIQDEKNTGKFKIKYLDDALFDLVLYSSIKRKFNGIEALIKHG